jgi:hypothetical protein
MEQEAFATIIENIEAAGAEMRACCARPMAFSSKPAACGNCGTFYAEPGLLLCKPCIDTINEIQERK